VQEKTREKNLAEEKTTKTSSRRPDTPFLIIPTYTSLQAKIHSLPPKNTRKAAKIRKTSFIKYYTSLFYPGIRPVLFSSISDK